MGSSFSIFKKLLPLQFDRFPAVLWLFCLVCGLLTHPAPGAAVVFSQESRAPGGLAEAVHQVILSPENFPDMWTVQFTLGHGRHLEIRNNLSPERGDDLDQIAEIVRSQYQFLARATGREVPGGVLLYLLEFPECPRYFRFTTELADSAPWNEVRLAMVEQGQALVGTQASHHLTRLLYDTLPHELTHSLLTLESTVRHDLDDQETQGTRWFIEGVCELMAKNFAQEFFQARNQSFPTCLQTLSPGPSADLRHRIWTWGQNDSWSPPVEAAFYPLAHRLVEAWCRQIPLPQLLSVLAASGGDHDGASLQNVLTETTGHDRALLMLHATRPDPSAELAQPLSFR